MLPGFHSLVGRRVDRYDVLAQLGQGGFGAVYRARHAVLGTEVALKVLWPERVAEPHAVERFLREARAAATIGSPHIVRVGDAGTTDDGVVFLTMELLEGHDLERELTARGRLSAHEALDLASQVLSALSAAHERGIVHRDLKPANVFLVPGPDGAPFVKLLDFGISKVKGQRSLTASGVALGTPQYMAPEQIEGRTVDARADVYAAGTMLYEMLSGALPFPGAGVDVIVRRLKGEKPPELRAIAPHVSEAIALVVHRALASDPDARWPSADAMAEALVAAEEGSLALEAPVTVPPEVRWRPLPPRSAGNHPVSGEEPTLAATPSPYASRAAVSSGPVIAAAPSSSSPPAPPPSASPPPTSWPAAPSSSAPAPSLPASSKAPSSWPSTGSPAVIAPSAPTTSRSTPSGAARAMGTPVPAPASSPAIAAAPDPSSSGRGVSPAVLGALGAIAVVIAVTAGALGVGAYKRFSRPPSEPPSTPAASAPRSDPPPASAPSHRSDLPTTDAPAAAPPPERPAASEAIEQASRTLDPSAVRYTLTSVTGLGPRSEVEALLERARPSVARCAMEGRALHLAIDFIGTTGGHVTISEPATQRHSDDRDVASCVARAVASAGPMRFNGWQTAIVELDVDLPAR